MNQITPIEWLQEVYKVTGKLRESDFDYANNWTKENMYTNEQVINIIDNISPNWYKCYTEEDKKLHLLKLLK